MAIYNGRILMRKGNEADFDPSKLMSGEWAVSLDAGIVRICLEAGKVIRMATYEAFEEDMKQIEAILLECQSIEEAVRRINTEVSEKLNACAEYVQQAKNYSEQAKTSEANSKSYMQSAKTSEENAKVSETNAKASENSAKEYENSAKLTEERAREVFESIPEDYSTISNDLYELAIKETATGYEIHRTDSSDLKLREFALYGKAKQNTTQGNQLFDANGLILNTNDSSNIEENGYIITLVGGMNKAYAHSYYDLDIDLVRGKALHAKLESISKSVSMANAYPQFVIVNADDTLSYVPVTKLHEVVTIPESAKSVRVSLYTSNSSNKLTESNTAVYKGFMVSLVDAEWEPYTGGIASPNPDYPQEIEVSGESYNLLDCSGLTEQTNGGVTFTPVYDENGSLLYVNLNGTSSEQVDYMLKSEVNFSNEKYIFSSGANGSNSTFFAYLSSGGVVIQSNDKEVAFTPSSETTYNCRIRMRSGITANNEKFYPMIRKASVKNNRYMPYGVGSMEVKSIGKNLFKNARNNITHNGITYKINDKGLIVLNGTATETAHLQMPFVAPITAVIKTSDKAIENYDIYPWNEERGTRPFVDESKNATVSGYINSPTTEMSFYVEKGKTYSLFYRVQKGVTLTNKIVYPMVSVVGGEYQPYKETLSTIPTENGLAGIKVSSNGNYTDSNGQQWICDEIVKNADGSGKRINNIENCKLADLSWTYTGNEGERRFVSSDLVGVIKEQKDSNSLPIALCDSYRVLSYADCYGKYTDKTMTVIFESSGLHGQLWIINTDFDNVEDFKNSLGDSLFYYQLKEPIITPLTAEEIAEIEKLHTFYPVTNISNDFDCGMSVMYYCDSKNYISNQLAIMKQEQEEAMMNMLLLMPTEVQATMIENDTNDLLKESEI